MTTGIAMPAGHVRPAAMPTWTVAIVGAVVLVAICSPLAAALEYQRGAWEAGALWRGVTSHLTHWSWSHMLWNLIGFTLLGACCERTDRRLFVRAVTSAAVAIPFALAAFAPALTHYRGLSGIVVALFACTATTLVLEAHRRGDRLTALVTAALSLAFVARMVAAWSGGETLLSSSLGDGVATDPVSHIVGLACGTVVAVCTGGRSEPNRR